MIPTGNLETRRGCCRGFELGATKFKIQVYYLNLISDGSVTGVNGECHQHPHSNLIGRDLTRKIFSNLHYRLVALAASLSSPA
jgi:hypothetical protein